MFNLWQGVASTLPSLSFVAFMGKSEYFEVRKVEGEIEQPQIILDAEAIYDLLLRAELMMTKVNRMRYANRAIEQILDVIREFMLSYNRTIRNCRMAILKWNRLVYPSRLEHFLASINSFIGLMKHRSDYGKIRDLVDEVSPKWLKYCHYNDDRRCFEANEGYKYNDILIRKYGFKFNQLKHKYNDKTRNRRQEEFPCLSRPWPWG